LKHGDLGFAGLDGERRAPHGARGLKHDLRHACASMLIGRAPHGARGLKLWQLVLVLEAHPVAPRTGRVG